MALRRNSEWLHWASNHHCFHSVDGSFTPNGYFWLWCLEIEVRNSSGDEPDDIDIALLRECITSWAERFGMDDLGDRDKRNDAVNGYLHTQFGELKSLIAASNPSWDDFICRGSHGVQGHPASVALLRAAITIYADKHEENNVIQIYSPEKLLEEVLSYPTYNIRKFYEIDHTEECYFYLLPRQDNTTPKYAIPWLLTSRSVRILFGTLSEVLEFLEYITLATSPAESHALFSMSAILNIWPIMRNSGKINKRRCPVRNSSARFFAGVGHTWVHGLSHWLRVACRKVLNLICLLSIAAMLLHYGFSFTHSFIPYGITVRITAVSALLEVLLFLLHRKRFWQPIVGYVRKCENRVKERIFKRGVEWKPYMET